MAELALQYSPKQVAEALQVSESSVKRWCDQGAINTVKTVGGHRRIPLSGLLEFLRARHQRLLRPEILGLGAVELPRPRATTSDDNLARSEGFVGALARGDLDACRTQLAKRCDQLKCFAEACEELVTAAMHQFGDAWECQRLEVYQERRGCELCRMLMRDLRDRLPPVSPDAPIAIGAAPAGDPYQLPSAMVELALRETGWAATNLGNDLPFETLARAISEYRPRLFWLSVSSISDTSEFVQQFNAFSDRLGAETMLLIGGRALTEAIRPHLRYTAYCDRLTQAMDFAMATRQRSSRSTT